MTIKQLGGVFGRNPTFNDVTIEGELTFDGDIDINSDLKVNGDLEVIGDVGINVSDPIYPLEVQGQAGIELFSSTTSGKVLNFRPSLGDANKYNMSISGYDHSGGGTSPADGLSINAFDGVSIATGSSTVRQERFLVDQTGNVKIATGNLVISTSGKGIDFSATAGPNPPASGTSELLDDYEEGVWTPTVTAGSGSITSYSSSGTYTKTGRQVTISGIIQITNNGTGASYLNVAGLPFTIGTQGGSGAVRSSGFGGHLVAIQAPNGGTAFAMWKYDNTYPVGTNSQMNFSFSYFV
jgi:hypothetical protein